METVDDVDGLVIALHVLPYLLRPEKPTRHQCRAQRWSGVIHNCSRCLRGEATLSLEQFEDSLRTKPAQYSASAYRPRGYGEALQPLFAAHLVPGQLVELVYPSVENLTRLMAG